MENAKTPYQLSGFREAKALFSYQNNVCREPSTLTLAIAVTALTPKKREGLEDYGVYGEDSTISEEIIIITAILTTEVAGKF